MDLATLQAESTTWREKNFPDYTAGDQLVGAVEELGELAHHFLKQREGIRTYAKGDKNLEALMDAVGDLVIYLAGFCEASGFELAEAVTDTWAQVKKRNWIDRPETG